MPFKGDGRLGGRRRNDSTLNGMSDGPSYPAAGTVLSTLSNVEYTLGLDYSFTYTDEGTEYTATGKSQRCSVNIVADGLGGDYQDYANAFNIQFYPSGHLISNISNGTSYVSVNGNNYVNGYTTRYIGHDGYGSGGIYNGTSVFTETGMFHEQEEMVNAEANGNFYGVGNGWRQFFHNGTGGYTEELANVVYYPYDTSVGSESGNTYVNINGTDYVNGSYTNNAYSDGYGGVYFSGGGSSYYSYGTPITSMDGYDYFHDGYGGYYSQQSYY